MRTQKSHRGGNERGSMLIIALGVLALLSILAITFVSLMKLELLASKNYVDGVKARLIAEGGLEEAISELKAIGGLDGVTPIDDPLLSMWVYANGNYWVPIEESSAIRAKSDPKYDPNRKCSFTG